MEDDRPTAMHADAEEDAEDALPDWSQFAAFRRSNADSDALLGRSTLVPFIPKRGEKDFEPLPPNSSLPAGSTEATLSTHQQHLLSSSRHALYSALSSGSRHHSSKAHNSFTWRPELGRATCDSEDGIMAHGIHFGNIGHFHLGRKRLELLPEEALYMNERGGIELWREYEEDLEEGGQVVKKRVPMSVQQAWAECLGHYDLTPERYQVYAFLRRLGYVVVRARPIPGTSRPVWIPPPQPFYLRLLKLFTHPLYFLRDTLLRAVREAQIAAMRVAGRAKGAQERNKVVKRVKWTKTREVGKEEGRFESLVAGGRWTSYDQIFARLQIIPTCALQTPSRPLRAPTPHTPSPLTPLAPTSTITSTSAEGDEEQEEERSFAEYPYQTFYHVYKPVTKYKKNNPPPPDFRLVIVNAATTPVPTLFELSALFESIPLPDDYDEDADPYAFSQPPPLRQLGPSAGPAAAAAAKKKGKPAAAPSAASPSSSPAATSPPTKPSLLPRLLSYLPSSLTSLLPSSLLPSPPTKRAPPRGPKPKDPSPYPFLKLGRRNVLLAVVDNGTSSILRVGEGEFGKVPWRGEGGGRGRKE
ncbi:hypothetical protein JCM8547_006601 [Rhodosporidiobolus lusitaniae]